MTSTWAIPRPSGALPLRQPVVYLHSARFDYNRWPVLHGPRYGEALGLSCRPWQAATAQPSEAVLVVDQRLLPEDVAELELFARRHPQQRLVLRVVDPYWPPDDHNPLRELAFRLVDRPATAVLLAYQPAEVTELLQMAYGPRRVWVSPYPYLACQERPLHQPRRPQLIISGNAPAGIYPLRALARLKRRRSWAWRRFSCDLAHPGYWPGGGSRSRPALLGADYLNHLAGFEAMFLCPSRAGLEFFKYGECAAAGCAPVGAPARGLPPAAAACVVPFDPAAMAASIRRIVRTPREEWRERAAAYRQAIAAARDPALLRRELEGWLQRLWPAEVTA